MEIMMFVYAVMAYIICTFVGHSCSKYHSSLYAKTSHLQASHEVKHITK